MIYRNKADIDEWLNRTDIPLLYVLKTGFPLSPKCHARVIDERGRSELTVIMHSANTITFRKASAYESSSKRVNKHLDYLMKCYGRTAQTIRDGDIVSVLIIDSKRTDEVELHVGVIGKINLHHNITARLID